MWLVGAVKVLVALQAGDAAVAGSVRDAENGDPVAGAIITLTDLGRVTVADSHGRYMLRSVPPGPQHVIVRRIGYAARALHALVPRTGELRFDVVLRREPLRLRVVDVRPPIAVRDAGEGVPGGTVDRRASLAAIRNHPLLAEPDALVALSGGAVVLRAESPTGVHIRGGAADQTAYVLDGVPVFSPYHAAGTFSAWNPDALAHVDVSSLPVTTAPLDVLSGTVAATTRTPGSRIAVQGGLSTTQARLTVDGPAGLPGSGVLVSYRTGFPGFIAPEGEPSYLRGESGDLLAKLEAPLFGGHGRVLAFDTGTEIGAAAEAANASASAGAGSKRHDFEWHSRSAGVEWTGTIGRVAATVQAWSASGTADALWHRGAESTVALASARQDVGFTTTAMLQGSATERTSAAVHVRQSRTRYHTTSFADREPSLALDARTPIASVVVGHERAVAHHLFANIGVSATTGAGNTFLGPRALLRWDASPTLALSGSYARSHQFAQSLRNAESIIGTVFPVDLFVGANTPGVPVGRADNGVVAVELHPLEGMRVGAQGYLRKSTGLLLAAPRASEPFAVAAFATGTGAARGISVDAEMSAARYGAVASYGWQRVRVAYDESSYAPDYATVHLVEAGAIVFPSTTSSIRVGAAAAMGRRASGLLGSLESEGCNLLDRGCELAGAPALATGELGATKLPPYLRVDIGARKHWDLAIAGRNATVALFGTITNVFGRRNVLSVTTDAVTGARADIGMRPLAPLVVGIDWRF